MAIQDEFFVRVGFEDALITVLRNAVDRCVSKKDELFDCGIKLDLALIRRSAGDSAGDDGLVALSAALKGLVSRFESMFPDYSFEISVGFRENGHQLARLTIHGKTRRSKATKIRDKLLELPGFKWLKEIMYGKRKHTTADHWNCFDATYPWSSRFARYTP